MRQTLSNLGLLILRVLFGVGIMLHGYQKVFGGGIVWLIEDTAKMGFPLPFLFAWAAALTELAGGLFIVIGLGTRPAALFLFFNMSVAVFIHHRLDPLHVKELAVAYWAVALAMLFTGPGRFSVDRILRIEKN